MRKLKKKRELSEPVQLVLITLVGLITIGIVFALIMYAVWVIEYAIIAVMTLFLAFFVGCAVCLLLSPIVEYWRSHHEKTDKD